MTDMTRIGLAPWPIVSALVAVAVASPGLQAQEVESPREVATAEVSNFDLLVGLRGEFFGAPSPGASVDLVLDGSRSPVWVSLQFLAQMVRWNVQYDPRTRRDHHYRGRIRLGLGKGQGPRIYALAETGFGVVMTEPEVMRGDVYNMTGVGLGGGLRVRRLTWSVEAILGGANRHSPDLYASLGVSIQYHLRPSDPR